MGGQFWVKRSNLNMKTFFLKLNPFSGGKYPITRSQDVFDHKKGNFVT